MGLFAIDLEADSTQYGQTSTTTLTDGLATMTLELWYKPESLNAYRPLITKGSSTVMRWLMDYENDSDKIWFIEAGTSKSASTSTGQLVAGTYVHIAMVYNGGLSDPNKVVFYINGSAVSTSVDASFPTTIPTGTRSLKVGQTDNTGANGDGLYTEVRIWNTARSAAQILANYKIQLTGTESGLIWYLPFQEGSGSTVADLTSSALNLSLVNTPSWSTNYPFVVGGTVGAFEI